LFTKNEVAEIQRNIFFTELGFFAQNIFLALVSPIIGGKEVLFPIPKDSKADIEACHLNRAVTLDDRKDLSILYQ
jgi:hypothetical protein